jgi:SAM-dependent methyltransferase
MRTPKPWYEEFFSGLWLAVQTQSKTEAQTRQEADFIQQALRPAPGAALLDVPCGAGRHCVELAARGYCLTGVDLTLALLEEGRRKAADLGLEIRWEHRDMRTLPWVEEFDGAFCFWGSFGYFDHEDNLHFLEAACRVLKPGARFLLDTHVAETLLPRLSQQRDWKRVGETLVLEEKHYHPASGRTDSEWTAIRGETVFKKTTSIRLYTYRELSQLCQRAGFADLEAYGSLSGAPFGIGSPRLYLIATR